MSYIQSTTNFIANRNDLIAAKMLSDIIATGCTTTIDASTIQCGNSDHYIKIYPTPASTVNVTVDILAINKVTVLRSVNLNFFNAVTLITKMVYTSNGFGGGTYSDNSIEIVALKLLAPDNSESWGIYSATRTEFTISVFTNGTDTASIATNTNLVNNSPGTFCASCTFLTKNDTGKQYTGKTRLIAGKDGTGALLNGGIAAPTVMKMDNTYYLWAGQYNNIYVTDRSW